MGLNEIELDLLREDQIIGNNRLKIFDKIGTKAAITDYAIALGGFVALDYFTKGGENQLECRTGYYWTKTCDGNNDARAVSYDGTSSYDYVYSRTGGIRVALPYSKISKIASNEVIGIDGVVQLECGYLPKIIAPKQLQEELERLFQRDSSIKSIQKNYTVDSKNYDEYSEKVEPKQLDEMELTNGKKYTRVVIKPRSGEETVTFSNGESYKVGDSVWIERCPVIWYKDLEEDIVFNKDLIMSGIPFNHERNYTGDFSKTDMYEYLNTYLKRDLFSSYLKDADCESKQIADISMIEQLQDMNFFLESEIERMQQQITKNNQVIENYGIGREIEQGYAKVFKK